MRVSTKRVLSIGLSLLFILGALAVYGNFIRGAMSDVGKLRALVASKSSLFANQRQAVGQVKDLIAQFQNASRLQETVSLAMPNDEQAIQALRQIEAVVRTSAVVLGSVDFKTATLPKVRGESFVGRLGVVEMHLRADGAYGNLKQFMQLLESGVRVSNVTEFDYIAGGARPTDSLALTVETYYQQK
ncbi:MAG: hypothetical protein V1696_01295 [Candidatus Jorgensenbacteria bacterium]